MITLIREDEPFLMRERSGEELDEYDLVLCPERPEKRTDGIKSLAWHRGWAEARE